MWTSSTIRQTILSGLLVESAHGADRQIRDENIANDLLFVLCFVDDLHMAVGGATRWLTLWRFLVVMEMIGVPFSYHKFWGGFQSDYVGFWMDYSKFEIGLSERRATW